MHYIEPTIERTARAKNCSLASTRQKAVPAFSTVELPPTHGPAIGCLLRPILTMDANVILYTIVWGLLLLFIVWPLAFFCVSWMIFLEPFEALFLVLFKTDVVYTVDDFLERVVLWPRTVGKAIAEGSQSFPYPPSEGSTKERVSSTNGFDVQKILYSIAWFLLMVFIAMPLAYFLSWWWLVFMPFESIIAASE